MSLKKIIIISLSLLLVIAAIIGSYFLYTTRKQTRQFVPQPSSAAGECTLNFTLTAPSAAPSTAPPVESSIILSVTPSETPQPSNTSTPVPSETPGPSSSPGPTNIPGAQPTIIPTPTPQFGDLAAGSGQLPQSGSSSPSWFLTIGGLLLLTLGSLLAL